MLGELLEVAFDVADSCAPCAGNDPSDVVWPGAGASGAAGGAPGSNPPGDPSAPGPPKDQQPEREPSNRDRKKHDRSDREYEKELQRKNAQDTIWNLAWEWFTSPAGGLGKVTGPLGTVAAGAEPLAEGVANVRESDVIREDRIYRESDGAIGKPRPESAGKGSQPDAAPADTGQSPKKNARQSEADARAQREFERTMENIRIKEQVRQAGNAGNDSWKNWR